MKKTYKLALWLSLIALAFLACNDDTDPTDPGVGKAQVRFIHISSDAPDLDLEIEAITNNITISNLSYPASTAYIPVDAGVRQVIARPGGADTSRVMDVSFNFEQQEVYTVFAAPPYADDNHLEAVTVFDNRDPDANRARLRFINMAPDAAGLDVKLNDAAANPLFANVGFMDGRNYTNLSGGAYSFVVTLAGQTEALATFQPVTLQNWQVYTLVAHGTVNPQDDYPFGVRAYIDNDPGNNRIDLVPAAGPVANVMVIHASPDAPEVDLFVEDVQLNADSSPLRYRLRSNYIRITNGLRHFELRDATAGTVLLEQMIDLAPNAYYSVFAANDFQQFEYVIVDDDLSTTPTEAMLRFVHLSPDAPAVDAVLLDSGPGGSDLIPDGFTENAFGQYSTFEEVPVGARTVQIRRADDDSVLIPGVSIVLDTGKHYTVWLRGLVNGSGETALGLDLITNTED